MRVELIYDADCPNVNEARKQLLLAFTETCIEARWQEWERGAPESPAYASSYGSPTILIDGEDVAGISPTEGADCCRIYQDGKGGLGGVPPVDSIARKLRESSRKSPDENVGTEPKRGFLRSTLALFPGIGVILLPGLTCPACWPAYAGLLTSLGVGFFNYTPYLLPFTIVFMILAVSTLAYRARKRRGYKPFVTGTLAAVLVMIGKFLIASIALTYVGIALLIAASVWNAWPQTNSNSGSCPSCIPSGNPSVLRDGKNLKNQTKEEAYK